uniref:Uncharacterized protein n=1 Tax=Globodera rostochiensis TaxID=31243 RepID=A0A914IE85_GLORO
MQSSLPLGANVFLTGANRGIGLGLELKELAKCNKALKLVKIDVSSDESIQNAVKVLGSDDGLNTLINNAGILEKGGTLKAPDRAVYLRHFNVNVVGTVATTAAFLPLLRKTVAPAAAANSGAVVRVVNIGGPLGCIGKVFLTPSECPYQNVAYGMSKVMCKI